MEALASILRGSHPIDLSRPHKYATTSICNTCGTSHYFAICEEDVYLIPMGWPTQQTSPSALSLLRERMLIDQ